MVGKVYAEGVHIGDLGPHPTMDIDWPRYYFSFTPTPAYERYRDKLDVSGRRPDRAMLAYAEGLDLRVDDLRLKFLFLDESRGLAVIREGMIRRSPEETDESDG